MQLIPFGGYRPMAGTPRRNYRGHILDEGRPPAAWRYIYLACGHITTPEDQLLFRSWKPSRGKYLCEQCHKWVKSTDWFTFHGIARPVESTEPMF